MCDCEEHRNYNGALTSGLQYTCVHNSGDCYMPILDSNGDFYDCMSATTPFYCMVPDPDAGAAEEESEEESEEEEPPCVDTKKKKYCKKKVKKDKCGGKKAAKKCKKSCNNCR